MCKIDEKFAMIATVALQIEVVICKTIHYLK